MEASRTDGSEPCPGCGRVNVADARFCASCGLALATSMEAMVDAAADPLVGRVVADRYKIQKLLGRGGMGVVYRVEHVHIGKLMAIKLLHGELARDKDTVKRFKREAEAASRLNHPNTVQIFDFGRDEGLTFIVMEFVDGKDLGTIVQAEGPLDMRRVARLVAQICASVGQAHGFGIVHRDLKPENVMIVPPVRARHEHVKVLDFGLAKLRHADDGAQTLTRAGSIIGTPYYMAPEHIRGDDVDARADIYSLGAVMYRALTGSPPFSASSPMGVLTKHLTDPVVPPRERSGRRDLPDDADRIVLRAMEKDPNDRYQRMEDLRADLVEFLASVGEDLRDPTTGASHEATATTSPSGRQRAVATRGDVDRYERRLRRRGLAGMVVAGVVLAGAAVGAALLLGGEARLPVGSRETEPNDEPATADRLPAGVTVRGYLGRRQSETTGDHDVYVTSDVGARRGYFALSVTGIPNIDIAVDVVKAGIETPVLVVDSTPMGGGERVPSFPLTMGTYYLRVREAAPVGVRPTENVSDAYSIRWDFVDPPADGEREVNDTVALAERVSVGDSRRGHIGWAGDRDTWCVHDAVGPFAIEVDGVESLDLVLRVTAPGPRGATTVDDGGVGEAEATPPLGATGAGPSCVEVSAADSRDAARADPDNEYVLRVRAVEGR